MPNYTTNYKMKKPLGNENYNIEDFNTNMDTIDTKIKEVETKANNITVPVQSVNNKTGAVVLNSTDIKCTDGTTVEAKLNTKADTFNVSDNVHSTSSTDVASSKAVNTAFIKATQAFDLAGSKQDFNVISEKPPHAQPSEYPLGVSAFYTDNVTRDEWKKSCGVSGSIYAVVETCHAKMNYGIIQKITWYFNNHSIYAIFERASYSQSAWGKWIQILDSNSISDSTTSTSTTDVASSYAVKQAMDKANEAFTYASNGKELISNAITGKGVNASKTDTFPELADKISSISTGIVPPWSVKNMQDKWIEGSGNRPGFAYHHGMCSVGNDIYLMGGWESGPREDNLIYHTLTDTWSTGKDVPKATSRSFCSHVGKYIYYFAGYNSTSTMVCKYDIEKDTWVSTKTLTGYDTSDAQASATIGNLVYFFDFAGSITIYNVDTHTISKKSKPSQTGGIVTDASDDGKLIHVLFTDYNRNRAIKTYDTKSDTWKLTTVMPDDETHSHLKEIQSSCLVYMNNCLYVLGGYGRYPDGSGSSVLADTRIYDLTTQSWRRGGDLLKRDSSIYAIAVNNNIYNVATKGTNYPNVYIPKFNL